MILSIVICPATRAPLLVLHNTAPSRVPRALLQLFPYNKPGLKDTPPSGRSLTRGEGRGDVEYS